MASNANKPMASNANKSLASNVNRPKSLASNANPAKLASNANKKEEEDESESDDGKNLLHFLCKSFYLGSIAVHGKMFLVTNSSKNL